MFFDNHTTVLFSVHLNLISHVFITETFFLMLSQNFTFPKKSIQTLRSFVCICMSNNSQRFRCIGRDMNIMHLNLFSFEKPFFNSHGSYSIRIYSQQTSFLPFNVFAVTKHNWRKVENYLSLLIHKISLRRKFNLHTNCFLSISFLFFQPFSLANFMSFKTIQSSRRKYFVTFQTSRLQSL